MGWLKDAAVGGAKGSSAFGNAIPGFLFGGVDGAKSGWKGGYNIFNGGGDDDDNDTIKEFKQYLAERDKTRPTSESSTRAKTDLLKTINEMNISSSDKARLTQKVLDIQTA